jgi:hypothetical protein
LDGESVKEPYFQGTLADGTYLRLEDEYVRDNFPTSFVDKVVEKGSEGKSHAFIHVPPGAPRTDDGHEMMDRRLPRIKYRQSGQSTCLFSSVASALFYLGVTNIAQKIACEAPKYAADAVAATESWRALLRIMGESCRFLIPEKLQLKAFDVLRDISEYPTVMTLEAVDGGTQHAVTVVGKYIFDANCVRVLPLTTKSLDYCCSTDSTKGKYSNVYRGYRFCIPKNTRKFAHYQNSFLKKLEESSLILSTVDIHKDDEYENEYEDE